MSLLLQQGRAVEREKKKKRKCRSLSQDARRVVISCSSCVCVYSAEGRVHLLCLLLCERVCVEACAAVASTCGSGAGELRRATQTC